MSSAFHDQPQIVFPREVHRRRDVICIARGNGVNAGFAHPCVHPSQRFRHAGLVSDVIRIVNIADQILATRAPRVFDASFDRKFHGNQISVDLIAQALPCRLRRPIRI